MKTIKVPGKNNAHNVLLYTLSTCVWCNRTKRLLNDNSVQYEYIDIDLCDKKEQKEVREDIRSRGGSIRFPTILIDDKILISGFHPDKILEALEIGNA